MSSVISKGRTLAGARVIAPRAVCGAKISPPDQHRRSSCVATAARAGDLDLERWHASRKTRSP
jgi:hypothetical protein